MAKRKENRVKKYFRHTYYKVVRQSGTPQSIARGMAVGVFIGFVIPVGFQVVAALIMAVPLKANKLVAVIGTFGSNHFTIPFIYPAQCYLGALCMLSPLSLSVINDDFKALLHEQSWAALKGLGAELLIPFLIGGLVLGVVSWPPTYYATYWMVVKYRAYRSERLRKNHPARAGDSH
jgi:uncharacterized protein (DUF2062 family)